MKREIKIIILTSVVVSALFGTVWHFLERENVEFRDTEKPFENGGGRDTGKAFDQDAERLRRTQDFIAKNRQILTADRVPRENYDDAFKLVQKSCIPCHSGNAPGGDYDFSSKQLLSEILNEERDFVIETIKDSPMPPKASGWKKAYSRKYQVEQDELQKMQLTDEERARLIGYLNSYEFVEKTKRSFLSQEEIINHIYNDLSLVHPNIRHHMRYVSFANFYNSGSSSSDIIIFKYGIHKLLSSLTWISHMVKISEVENTFGTVLRIDLRHLVDTKKRYWDSHTWHKITKHNPYYVHTPTKAHKVLRSILKTDQYLVRGDWLAFALSRPPLYHDLQDLPTKLEHLEMLIGINIQKNIIRTERASGPRLVHRGGTTNSGVSDNHRIIERHDLPNWSGAFWISYDFLAPSDPKKDIRKHPFGPFGEDPFLHDGGEVIFTLPNGLQSYLLIDSKGNRIDVAPTEIVQNKGGNDARITNGISCFECHTEGIRDIKFEMRNYEASFVKSKFTKTESLKFFHLYAPDKTKVYMELDKIRYLEKLKYIHGRDITFDPISKLVNEFNKRVSFTKAASELNLKESGQRSLFGLFEKFKSIADMNSLQKQLTQDGLSRENFIHDFSLLRERLPHLSPDVSDYEYEFEPLPSL
jgi:hypothetical protein